MTILMSQLNAFRLHKVQSSAAIEGTDSILVTDWAVIMRIIRDTGAEQRSSLLSTGTVIGNEISNSILKLLLILVLFGKVDVNIR